MSTALEMGKIIEFPVKNVKKKEPDDLSTGIRTWVIMARMVAGAVSRHPGVRELAFAIGTDMIVNMRDGCPVTPQGLGLRAAIGAGWLIFSSRRRT